MRKVVRTASPSGASSTRKPKRRNERGDQRPDLRLLLEYSPRTAREARPQPPGAPEMSADGTTHDPHQARRLLHAGPRAQGQAPRARRPGLRLFDQAPLRPETHQPVAVSRRGKDQGRRRGDGGREEDPALRLRPAHRGARRARPVHAAHPAQQHRLRLSLRAGLAGHRRRGARGARILRRRFPRAPGRHRPLPPQGMGARLARGARGESRFREEIFESEGATTRLEGDRRAPARQEDPDRGPRRDLRDRRGRSRAGSPS